ncbi:MAG: PAC2 family protein [Candidatus Nanopelagicales bacterium]
MRDPADLITWHGDPTPVEGRTVLVHAFTGFLDAAGATQMAAQLLQAREPRLLATIDPDEVLDYRARRPMLTFVTDHFAAVDMPQIALHEVSDASGTPFLLLTGPEPDYQWQRFSAAILDIVRRTGTQLTVGLSAIPWPAPHTRPLGVTVHGNDPALVDNPHPMAGNIQVPGHIGGLLELSLGQAGERAIGIATHVPHYLGQFEYPTAAIRTLEALTSVTGLEIPVESLRAPASRAEGEIAQQLQSNEEFVTIVRALEQQYDQMAALRASQGAVGGSDLAPGGEVPSGDEIAAQVEQFLAQMHDRESGDAPE